MANVIQKQAKILMEQAFIDYAMSVITDRALPDIRDGMKPVHRRILFAMHESGNDASKAYRKSARMVGDVIGKYHPHGDSSVYGAAVRMAQPFSMGELLIDGQGNFGSIDGDNPAAMRYTEMRMTRLAGEFFQDLHKETVVWQDNYDGSEKEPSVLTAPYPNILVNGTDGIAVGMASSIPPHNLRAVIKATLALMNNPGITDLDLFHILEAPDFPTGAIVHGLEGFMEAIGTGHGRVKLRAKWHEEDRARGGKSIVVDELPYQVNKADLVSKIAELVRNKKIDGITDLRDESSKEGVRIVIEIRRDESPDATFSTLCGMTALESAFNYNCVVLDNGIPHQLGLRTILEKWLAFRKEVVLKRHIFDRKQAEARLHILEGFMAAIGAMDRVISLIRGAANTDEAKTGLMTLLSLDEKQSEEILKLRLQKLTGMELDGIRAEHAEVTARVKGLTEVIESPERIKAVICAELEAIDSRYGHARRTEIGHDISAITRADTIPQEDVVIVITRKGYVKRLPVSSISSQNRGTRGKRSIDVGEDDEISAIYDAHTHDIIMVFDETGQVFSCYGYDIPESGPSAKGRHIKNVIDGFDREIASIIRVPSGIADLSITTITSDGTVKRSALEDYKMASRMGGVIGITLVNDSRVVAVFPTMPGQHLMVMSSGGRAIRFCIDAVREIGRVGQGVRGMRLPAGDTVIGAYVTDADSTDSLVCIGENGVGKRTPVSEFPIQARGGQGVMAFKTSNRTGELVSAFGATTDQDVVMLASNGVSNRISVADIREIGRATSGVYLMNLDAGAKIISATTVARMEQEQQTEQVEQSALAA
jgi:DNA gyrase subunit A